MLRVAAHRGRSKSRSGPLRTGTKEKGGALVRPGAVCDSSCAVFQPPPEIVFAPPVKFCFRTVPAPKIVLVEDYIGVRVKVQSEDFEIPRAIVTVTQLPVPEVKHVTRDVADRAPHGRKRLPAPPCIVSCVPRALAY